MKNVLLCLVPIFIAIDPLGLVPVYLSLTEKLDAGQKRRVTIQSIATALIVSGAFLLVGKFIFKLLGITIDDFKVAGGLLLLVMAIKELVAERPDYGGEDSVGIVPLGVPLIVGPAVLTTALITVDVYGAVETAAALLINLLFLALLLAYAGAAYRLLGKSGMRGVSKIVSLLLAAIAVMMIRIGLKNLIGQP